MKALRYNAVGGWPLIWLPVIGCQQSVATQMRLKQLNTLTRSAHIPLTLPRFPSPVYQALKAGDDAHERVF